MNFFFFAVNQKYNSRLAIPKFQNSGKTDNELGLYQGDIVSNRWNISKADNIIEDERFWYLHDTTSANNAIFFLSNEREASKLEEKNQLRIIEKFTDTNPSYRANLMIENSLGALSSYQTEYPFRMVEKLGSFYTDCGLLTSDLASSVGIFIRNIHFNPILEERDLWLFSLPKNEVLQSYKLKLNNMTYIDLTEYKNELSGCFLFAKDFSGVPSWAVEYDDGSLSFEHTHPPHESILGDNKFELVRKLRENAFEKISKALSK